MGQSLHPDSTLQRYDYLIIYIIRIIYSFYSHIYPKHTLLSVLNFRTQAEGYLKQADTAFFRVDSLSCLAPINCRKIDLGNFRNYKCVLEYT